MSRHIIKLDDGSGPLCYIDILGDESTEDLFVENTPANIREYYRLAEANWQRLEWVSRYKMQLPCIYSHIDPFPTVFGAYARGLIQSCESVPIGTPLPKELPTDYHQWSNELIRGVYHKDEIRAIEQLYLDAMDDVLSGRPVSDEFLPGQVFISSEQRTVPITSLLDEREEINEQYKDALTDEINRVEEGSNGCRTETLAEGSSPEDQ